MANPLECSICLAAYDLRTIPMAGRCGHSICFLCVNRIVPKNCPICRTEEAFASFEVNRLAYEMIKDIMTFPPETNKFVQEFNGIRREIKEIKDKIKFEKIKMRRLDELHRRELQKARAREWQNLGRERAANQISQRLNMPSLANVGNQIPLHPSLILTTSQLQSITVPLNQPFQVNLSQFTSAQSTIPLPRIHIPLIPYSMPSFQAVFPLTISPSRVFNNL